MTDKRPFSWVSWMIAAAAVITAGIFGWNSRDFGWFLVGIFVYLPALTALCAGLAIWKFFEKRPERKRLIGRSLTLIAVLTSASLYVADHFRDRVTFMLWYPAHYQLVERFARKDGVIAYWGSYGLAGDDSDQYVVSNPRDDIYRRAAAAKWAEAVQPGCGENIDTERMMRGVYIVTMNNCPLP